MSAIACSCFPRVHIDVREAFLSARRPGKRANKSPLGQAQQAIGRNELGGEVRAGDALRRQGVGIPLIRTGSGCGYAPAMPVWNGVGFLPCLMVNIQIRAFPLVKYSDISRGFFRNGAGQA
ncbi:MAG: hypothetical protein AB7E05_12895 [Sphingobium sp.]